MKDRDIIVGYTDGFTDNVFPAMWPNCLIDNIDKQHGVITSLSQTADCYAQLASISSKMDDYKSPFMTQWETTVKTGQKSGVPPPDPPVFMGGKQDDITVTVAQFFIAEEDPKKKDTMRSLASDDTHFKDSKTVYKKPFNAEAILKEKKKADAQAAAAASAP